MCGYKIIDHEFEVVNCGHKISHDHKLVNLSCGNTIMCEHEIISHGHEIVNEWPQYSSFLATR